MNPDPLPLPAIIWNCARLDARDEVRERRFLLVEQFGPASELDDDAGGEDYPLDEQFEAP